MPSRSSPKGTGGFSSTSSQSALPAPRNPRQSHFYVTAEISRGIPRCTKPLYETTADGESSQWATPDDNTPQQAMSQSPDAEELGDGGFGRAAQRTARPDLDQVQLGPSGRTFIGSIMGDRAPAGCGLREVLSLYLVVRWAMCAWVSTPAPKWEASAAVD